MNLPNSITVLRIAIIPVFLYFLVSEIYGAALLLFAFGSVTDALDGYIARKFDQVTDLGKILDPTADKLFLFFSFFASYFIGILPFWFFSIILLKEVIILTGLAALYLLVQKVDIKPNLIGKLSTTLQMITVMVILLDGYGIYKGEMVGATLVITAAVVCLSSISYVILGTNIYKKGPSK